MTDYHVNIFFSEEDGGYIADIPDLESCSAFGETPEKALAELQVAKKEWLEAAQQGWQANASAAVSTCNLPALSLTAELYSSGGFVPRRSTCEFRN